jgi:hypothetical protein
MTMTYFVDGTGRTHVLQEPGIQVASVYTFDVEDPPDDLVEVSAEDYELATAAYILASQPEDPE